MKFRNPIYVVLILCLIFAASCKEKIHNEQSKSASVSEFHPDEKHEEKKHWSYEGETGPEHWAELEGNDCGGKYQSPIDILDPQVDESLSPLDIHYSTETKIHDVVNNGHSIQFNFDPGDYLVLNGERYELKQFHFHESAEHTIRGVRYPLVIHLVHVSKDGKYAVLAVMGEECTKNSKSFEFLDSYLPLAANETKPVDATFNMNDALPVEKPYYTYTGSLTTPPCTEGVQWFIFKKPLEVSVKMIKDLQGIMPINNYRNVQELNGRIVKESL